jgi:hypothetical protein
MNWFRNNGSRWVTRPHRPPASGITSAASPGGLATPAAPSVRTVLGPRRQMRETLIQHWIARHEETPRRVAGGHGGRKGSQQAIRDTTLTLIS